MRNIMEKELKVILREYALRLRHEHGLTQAKMADALLMSLRSYEDIECGHSSCGMLTAILLLMKVSENRERLDEFFGRVRAAYVLEEATV